MKSLLEELKEHQTTLENQQAQRLAGFSDQLTSLAADLTAAMDAIADLYEQVTAVQDQLATLEAEATPGTGNSTENADTTETEATTE